MNANDRKSTVTRGRRLTMIGALAALMCAGQAQAAADAHVQKDIDRHRQIAAAHEAAARCLQAGGKATDCEAQLRADCKGIAIGTSCGLRTALAARKDGNLRLADLATMTKAHTAAATCLASGTSHSDCRTALVRDCAGVGVGKYCGMRHAH